MNRAADSKTSGEFRLCRIIVSLHPLTARTKKHSRIHELMAAVRHKPAGCARIELVRVSRQVGQHLRELVSISDAIPSIGKGSID